MVILLVLALIALGVSFVSYRMLAHPSLAPYASLELRPMAPQGNSIRAMFLGVTTILLDDGETAIMTDGFFSRPGLMKVMFGRIEPDSAHITDALTKAGVTRLAAVLTAHSHYDHAMDSPEVAKRTGAQLVGSESTANIGRGLDFPEGRIRIIKGGETFTFGRFKITAIKSPHSPDGRCMGDITAPLRPPTRMCEYKEGGNYSYVIEHDGRRILVHPSANYSPGFLKNVQADLVFLGIGRLGKQSEKFAKDYWEEVIHATRAKVVIPIHRDDFLRALDKPLKPMPYLMDDFSCGMKIILRLAEADHVAVRFMPLFGSVNISEGIIKLT